MALIAHGLHILRAIKVFITWGSTWRFAWAYSARHEVPAEKPDYERLIRDWEDHYRRARRTGVNCFVEKPRYYAGEIIYIAWAGAPGALYKWQGLQGYIRCPDARVMEQRG
ncbi:hypothetical protein IHQ56_02615 [Methylobacillus flagellatus]|uniref:hypothetical protein n=1 Tax=Methylobacillus flagellatus TaxID=405 RepID=UPI0028540B1F|nr:hypothetical protein [Methylobacillus flagellatus]MDR5170702.1 hypothetical protein [Methylobacillus flagellatus]